MVTTLKIQSWKNAQNILYGYKGKSIGHVTRIIRDGYGQDSNFLIRFRGWGIIQYNANGTTFIKLPHASFPRGKALLERYENHAPVTITKVGKKKSVPAHWIITPKFQFMDEDDFELPTEPISTLTCPVNEWILIPSDPQGYSPAKIHNPLVQQRLCL